MNRRFCVRFYFSLLQCIYWFGTMNIHVLKNGIHSPEMDLLMLFDFVLTARLCTVTLVTATM